MPPSCQDGDRAHRLSPASPRGAGRPAARRRVRRSRPRPGRPHRSRPDSVSRSGGKSCPGVDGFGGLEHMFEGLAGDDESPEAVAGPAPVTAEAIGSWIAGLTRLDRQVDDAERVARLELLERLKSAAAAAQAEVTVDFVASQRAEQAAAGVAAAKVGAGVGAGGAGPAGLPVPRRPVRRAGPGVAVGAAGDDGRAPAGDTSQWWATIVARETACLDPADRAWRPTPSSARRWPGWVTGRWRRPPGRWRTGWTRRRSWTAPRGRPRTGLVTLRPAPDTMSRFCGFLPVALRRRRAHRAVPGGRPAHRRR